MLNFLIQIQGESCHFFPSLFLCPSGNFWVFFHKTNLFIYLFIFNWRIIALKCCVGLCQTSTWTSHRYICSFPLKPPSHLLAHHTPRVCRRHQIDLPMLYSNFPSSIYFTYGNLDISKLVSQFVPPSFAICVYKSVLYVWVSILSLQIVSSVPFFWIPYTIKKILIRVL